MQVTKHSNRIASDTASLADLKGMATRLLPETSELRMLILSEPDILPRTEVTVKLEIFLKLLYKELADSYAARPNNIVN